MKKIKLKLEYKDYLLWIYDEDNQLIDTGYPLDLEEQHDIKSRIEKIESEYYELFLDDGIEFKYIGFKNKNDERLFLQKVNEIYKELITLGAGQYSVEYGNTLTDKFSEYDII